MKKLDYLKLAIGWKAFYKKAWMISVFAVTREKEGAYVADPYPGRIIRDQFGLSFVMTDGSIVKIEDSKPNEPLFKMEDRLVIDHTWASNCSKSVETSIGTLLANHICLIACFKNKIPYMVGKVSIPQIETIIVDRFASNPPEGQPRSDDLIYVDEYMLLGKSIEFLKTLLQLCAYAATPKGLVPPTGLAEKKKELAIKYAGQLTDPVKLSQYEGELLKFDDDFLKDDPSYGKFTKGKIQHTARKKLFLSVGAEQGFTDTNKVVPITESLVDGWSQDPEKFTSMMNGLRSGSYSRGSETIKGGVAAKYMLRAANNFRIVDINCGSKLGLDRLYNKDNVYNLVGRTLIFGVKQIHVEKDTDTGNYLNNVLWVRSPMFCKLAGDNICKVCAGDNLARYSTGVTIPLTEISAILLSASLKAMHTSGMKTAELDIGTALS